MASKEESPNPKEEHANPKKRRKVNHGGLAISHLDKARSRVLTQTMNSLYLLSALGELNPLSYSLP